MVGTEALIAIPDSSLKVNSNVTDGALSFLLLKHLSQHISQLLRFNFLNIKDFFLLFLLLIIRVSFSTVILIDFGGFRLLNLKLLEGGGNTGFSSYLSLLLLSYLSRLSLY